MGAAGRPLLAQGRNGQDISSDVVNKIDALCGHVEEAAARDKDLRAKVEVLSNRLDAWTQSSPPLRRRRKREDDPLLPEDSPPTPDVQQNDLTKSNPLSTMRSSSELGATAPKSFPRPTAPSDGERSKPATCHDKCKLPTNPRALAMSQSLSRLPKLKGGGG